MQPCETINRSAILPKATPLFARLLSKLVLEVLPASAASVIGAVLLAHYQFGHPALSAGGMAAVAPAPASPEMLQLVRDEHDLIRNFLLAQQTAQTGRYAKADAKADAVADAKTAAPSAQDAADAELVAAALRRTADGVPARAPALHLKVAAVASAPPAPAAAVAAAPAVAPAPQQPIAVAGPQDSAAPPAAPEHHSLIATILSVKDHVVSAPLHAVKAIGGLPSWIGHRLDGDEPDSGEHMLSAAS
jgi:hypothetical protein